MNTCTLYRPVRELLDEAMVEVQPCCGLEDLLGILEEKYGDDAIRDQEITTEFQCVDHRIGWNSHIVLIGGSPWGYLNGPLPKDNDEE